MNIIDRFLSNFGYVKASTPTPSILRAEAEGSRYTIPDLSTVDKQARVYQQLTWIATAIDTLANVAATTEYSVYKLNGEDKDDIPNHEFELRLQKPNEYQGKFEFLRDFFSWLKLSGNGYLWLNKSSEFAPPAEMWIIPSNMIKPVPDGKMFLKGYAFYPPGGQQPIALETWEVSHAKTFNPFSRYVGLSAIESLALTVSSDLAEQKYNANYFSDDNGRVPGILAFADNIVDSEWDTMQREAREKSAASKRGFMMMRNTGPGGVQYLQAGATQKEMEFLATRQMNKEEIWSKLAPGLLQILDKNTTEANALAGKAVFSEYALYPLLCLAGQRWDRDIVDSYGDNLLGEFDDPRKSDKLMDLKEQEIYSQTHTVNEIRSEYYGDDEVEGGDVPVSEWKGSKPEPAPMTTTPAPEFSATDTTEAMGEANDDAIASEMKAWESFALRRLGKGGREFEPRAIPLVEAVRIKAELGRAKTPAEVKTVFGGGDVMAQAVKELARFNAIAEKRI